MPSVKQFLNDQHTLFIADINQSPGGRIMRHTNRITSHVLKDLHLTLNGSFISRRAKRALIMVHTYSLQLHRFPIKKKSFAGVKFKIAETKIRHRHICCIAA